MTVQLDPATLEKLQAIAHRRRWMVLVRGVFAGILSLLTAMALIALLDRLVILSQGVRIALSLAGYALVIATVYLTCMRYLIRIPTKLDLARLVEDAEPGLHEEVISAVELSGDKGTAYDSEVFRSILQRNVGRKLKQVDTDHILPWRLIMWWAGVSTGAVLMTVVLLLIPGLQYGQLLTRAMLPTANTDRVSDIKITILSPAPDGDGLVPIHTPVSVQVQVRGAEIDRVEIEVVREGDQTSRQAMGAEDAQGRYAMALEIQDRPVRFRIIAGDGRTRYVTLTPYARPRVETFSQVIHSPDYTQIPPRRITSAQGDITALAGSRIDLTLHASQPVERGTIVIENFSAPGAEPQRIPLATDPGDPTRLSATINLDRTAVYRVELVGKKTGFENTDSPRYEMIALADELPEVELISPVGTSGRSADAVFRLFGNAQDDVALASVAREIRINGGGALGDWVHAALEVQGEGQIQQVMDLSELNLRTGDHVELRLVATDRAGNVAYSTSAQLVVTPEGLRPADAAFLRAEQQLLDRLAVVRDRAQSLRERYRAAAEAGAGEIALRQAVTQANVARDQLGDAILKAQSRLEAALHAGQFAGVSIRADEVLIEVGQFLSQIQAEQLLEPQQSVDPAPYALARRTADQHFALAARAFDRLDPSLQVDHVQQAWFGGRLIESDLAQMVKDAEQDQAISETLAWVRLQRRLMGSASQTTEAAHAMSRLALRLEEGDSQRRARESVDRLRGFSETLRTGLTQVDPGPGLFAIADEHREAIHQQAEPMHRLLREMIGREHDFDRQRSSDSNLSSGALFSLRNTLNDTQADKTRSLLWDVAIDRLRQRATLEEMRGSLSQDPFAGMQSTGAADPGVDLGFVTDSSRAVSALRQLQGDDVVPRPPGLDVVVDNYDLLERIHLLNQLYAQVVQLADQEREDAANNPHVRDRFLAAHRRDVFAVLDQLHDVAHGLNHRSDLRPAAELVAQARDSRAASQIAREVKARVATGRSPESMADSLDELARLLQQAREEVAPKVELARETLNDLSQTLPERLRQLADQAEQLEKQSRQAAEEAEQQSSQENQRQAEALSERQAQLNEAVADAVDQMRRQANEENLLTAEGRERARDVDDAIAMLKPDAQDATQRLRDAADDDRPERQEAALSSAADAQQREAETLNQLAEHFENVEQGDEQAAENSREELRSNERELGMDQQLEDQYEQMERLAELAQADDAKRLAELEEMLRDDPTMRRELDRLAEEMVDQARENLEAAEQREREIAEELNQQGEEQGEARNATQQKLEAFAERAREIERDALRPLDRQVERGAPEARDDVQAAQESLREAAQQGKPDEAVQQQAGEQAEQQDRAQALAEQTQQAAESLEQAAQDAQAAVDDAERRHDEAQQRAQEANDRGTPDQQAARDAAEAARDQQQAEGAQSQAQEAAEQAQELAEDAQALAEQQAAEQSNAQQQREQAAQAQGPIGEQVEQAGEDVERAARHQERLGHQQEAEALQEQSESIGELGEEGIPQTGEAIDQAETQQQSAQAAREAEQQIGEQAEQLGQAQQGASQQGESQQGESQQGEQGESSEGNSQEGEQGEPGQQDGQGQPSGQGNPSSPEVARELAQELDQLDQQANQGAPSQQPGQRAIDQAAQAMAQQIRNARNQAAGQPSPSQAGQQPGGPPQPGEPNAPTERGGMRADQKPLDPNAMPDQLPRDSQGQWGDLPERMTDDLNQGTRERAPADYAEQVDAYFRAIAQRARAAREAEGNE